MSSIGGLDPLADAYNLMGMQGMTGQNPYLQYQGQIPMAGYYGTPTDASGKPIQSFLDAQAAHDAWNTANPAPPPGTTLNSQPAAASGNPYRQMPDPTMQALASRGVFNTPIDLGRGVTGQSWQRPPIVPHQQTPQAPQAAPQTNPIDMRQAYLDALANPGPVTTPGAQMLPGATPTGPVGSQPSVLQAFLSQHQGGGTAIPGGYTNQPFFNTLNNLQAQKGATS